MRSQIDEMPEAERPGVYDRLVRLWQEQILFEEGLRDQAEARARLTKLAATGALDRLRASIDDDCVYLDEYVQAANIDPEALRFILGYMTKQHEAFEQLRLLPPDMCAPLEVATLVRLEEGDHLRDTNGLPRVFASPHSAEAHLRQAGIDGQAVAGLVRPERIPHHGAAEIAASERAEMDFGPSAESLRQPLGHIEPPELADMNVPPQPGRSQRQGFDGPSGIHV